MHSRDSNFAGAPLPLIPRRSNSSSSSPGASLRTNFTRHHQRGLSDGYLPSSTSSIPIMVLQPPTPPEANNFTSSRNAWLDSDSDSTSESESATPTLVPRTHRKPSKNGKSSQESIFPASKNAMLSPSRPPLLRSNQTMEVRLRTQSDTIIAAATTASVSDTMLAASNSGSIMLPADVTKRLILKKSGEPLKSSLKSRSIPSRPALSVLTPPGFPVPTAMTSSKSEPATPYQPKAVHFDAKLEHVKLFLAEQRPIAVSRDGSPTDTSGTDGNNSDFPPWIYGGAPSSITMPALPTSKPQIANEELLRRELCMVITDLPPANLPGRRHADVALTELELSPDKEFVHGRVRVRNIAFEKWLAVRFTLDAWQTTSEVAGRHVASVDGGMFDLFGFSIRLTDMLARIEDRTLELAVKFKCGGREMWDNNDGRNFQVRFMRKKAPQVPDQQQQQQKQHQKQTHQQRRRGLPVQPRGSLSSDDDSADEQTLAELKSRLEKVAATGKDRPAPHAAHHASHDKNSRKDKTATPPSSPLPSPLPATSGHHDSSSLASRYNFTAALKDKQWKSERAAQPPHLRSHSLPSRGSIPWPMTDDSKPSKHFGVPTAFQRVMPLGSPRDRPDEESMYTTRVSPSSPLEDDHHKRIQETPNKKTTTTPVRNHTRGYFDLAVTPERSMQSLRRTPPGTPGGSGSTMRFNSFPPTSPSSNGTATPSPGGRPQCLTLDPSTTAEGDVSEVSTPALTSASSCSESAESTDSSALNSPDCMYSASGLATMMTTPSASAGRNAGGNNDYSAFVSRFCFFTGPESPASSNLSEDNSPMASAPTTTRPGASQHVHSISSLEDILATTQVAGAAAATVTSRNAMTAKLTRSSTGSSLGTASPYASSVDLTSGITTPTLMGFRSRSSTPVVGA